MVVIFIIRFGNTYLGTACDQGKSFHCYFADSTGRDIANKMNNVFCTVGDQLSKGIPDTNNSLLEGSINVNPENISYLFSQKVI